MPSPDLTRLTPGQRQQYLAIKKYSEVISRRYYSFCVGGMPQPKHKEEFIVILDFIRQNPNLTTVEIMKGLINTGKLFYSRSQLNQYLIKMHQNGLLNRHKKNGCYYYKVNNQEGGNPSINP